MFENDGKRFASRSLNSFQVNSGILLTVARVLFLIEPIELRERCVLHGERVIHHRLGDVGVAWEKSAKASRVFLANSSFAGL